MERKIKRGDIYYANLNPVIGSEQGGTRPVLIISNDVGNKHSPTVIVAPITSRIHTKAKLPTHTLINDFEGLDKNSIILFPILIWMKLRKKLKRQQERLPRSEKKLLRKQSRQEKKLQESARKLRKLQLPELKPELPKEERLMKKIRKIN